MPQRGTDLGIPGLGPAVPLARGGFAQVYLAEQVSLRRPVAVKVLFAAPTDRMAFARFERECHALGAVSYHPNIVGVHDRGLTSDGHHYLIMEYREGGSLADALAGGVLPPDRVTYIGIRIAEALAVAHEAGVVHRDVKPANILLSAAGEPALADFGIARIDGAGHTTTGQITASVAHAAREVLAGGEPTSQSDVYSLGSTLLELTTGRPPYHRPDDSTVWQLIHRVTHEPPPPAASLGVPHPLAAVIDRALSPDLALRYRTARELQAALAATGPLASPGTAPAGPTTPVPGGPEATTAVWSTVPEATADNTDTGNGNGTGTDNGNGTDTDTDTDTDNDTDTDTDNDNGNGNGNGTTYSAGSTGPAPAAPTGRRRRLAVGLAVLVAAAGGASVAAGGIDRLGFGADPVPVLEFAQAGIEPLVADRPYALGVVDAAAGARFQVVVDGTVVDTGSTSVPVYRAQPGRHRVAVEVVEPDGSTRRTDPVEVYVSPGPPQGGYRVNLAAVPIEADNWPGALRQFDQLVADGHRDLVLSAGANGEYWQFYIDGFGDDRDAAWAYCDRFQLGDDDCFAAAVPVPVVNGNGNGNG